MFSLDMFFPSRNFKLRFFSYSVAMLPGNLREDVDRGGKIIMPPSALDWLTSQNISYPMMFKLNNKATKRQSHAGVLEFIAEESRVYIPNWMMRNLMLSEGDQVEVESVTLPVATFSKFQPQSEDFLDIHDPKAVLENSLRLFACLTTGDIININYNDRDYELFVLETQPGTAVSIIECDMSVDFAPPEGYKPGTSLTNEEQQEEASEDTGVFCSFTGVGYRLDGKTTKRTDVPQRRGPACRGVPDYEWRVGTLNFIRSNKRTSAKLVNSK